MRINPRREFVYATGIRGNLVDEMKGQDNRVMFWAELETRIRAAGMTEGKFASLVGISPQGFSSWKERHQFRRGSLAKAARILDWKELDEDSAEKIFKLKLIAGRITPGARHDADDFVKALRGINMSYRRNIISFKRYADLSLTVLDALGVGGFFAFSGCTNSPYEFENTTDGARIAKAIAKAINRGILCLYIRPTEKGVAYYTKRWDYGRVVQQEEAVKELEGFRILVKKELRSGAAGTQRSASEADRMVYEQLDQCYVDRSPMWMPGVGLSMFGQFRAPHVTARMAITLPGGFFGGLLIYPHYYVLEVRFVRFLHKVVLDACREVRALQDDSTHGRVKLIVSSKQHIKYTDKFYKTFSKILRNVSSIEPPSD
jgi:hypothetical protein